MRQVSVVDEVVTIDGDGVQWVLYRPDPNGFAVRQSLRHLEMLHREVAIEEAMRKAIAASQEPPPLPKPAPVWLSLAIGLSTRWLQFLRGLR